MIFSIVSPVYKARDILPVLVERIETALAFSKEQYEIILVDDGCPDNSWKVLEKLCIENNKVKGLKLKRNFGQHSAILAGVSKAKGQYIVILDCDLQDNPDDIIKLYLKAKEGYDVVFTKRESQKHSFFKKAASDFFYLTFRLLFGNKFGQQYGSMLLFNRHLALQFLSLEMSAGNYVQCLLSIASDFSSVVVAHQHRYSGESSYSFYKLIGLGIMSLSGTNNKLSLTRVLLYSIILFFSVILFIKVDYHFVQIGDLSFWLLIANVVIFGFFMPIFYIGFLRHFFLYSTKKQESKLVFEIEKSINC